MAGPGPALACGRCTSQAFNLTRQLSAGSWRCGLSPPLAGPSVGGPSARFARYGPRSAAQPLHFGYASMLAADSFRRRPCLLAAAPHSAYAAPASLVTIHGTRFAAVQRPMVSSPSLLRRAKVLLEVEQLRQWNIREGPSIVMNRGTFSSNESRCGEGGTDGRRRRSARVLQAQGSISNRLDALMP
jgi:hypothetical protein